MRILDRSKPAAAPSLAPPLATQVHNLVHPIHVNFLDPQLVVPLGEHVVHRPEVSADEIIILNECKLERTRRGPGKIIPQQGEVHPCQPGRVGRPMPRNKDTPPGFILGRERHGQGPRLQCPPRGAAAPVVGNAQQIHPDPAISNHGGGQESEPMGIPRDCSGVLLSFPLSQVTSAPV